MLPQLKEYQSGKVALPSWIESKERKFYLYSGSKVLTSAPANFQIDIQLDPDSYFLVEGIQMVQSAIGTSGFAGYYAIVSPKVQIIDQTFQRPWSSDFVSIYDAAGIGMSPRRLPEPNLLRPSATLTVKVQPFDPQTASTFFVAVYGRKVYGLTPEEVDFLASRINYQYVLPIPTLTTLQTGGIQTVKILDDSEFLWKRTLASSVYNFLSAPTAAFSTVNYDILMNIQDLSTNKTYFSAPTPVWNVAGSYLAQPFGNRNDTNGVPPPVCRPFNLPRPVRFTKDSIVQGTFSNMTGTTATGLNVILEGSRIFR